MPTVTDLAICLRRWDYSETSQTVSLFLREHGIVRGLVKGARRPGGAFDGGCDPLTHGQVVAIIKPASDLATVTAWRVAEVFRVVREDMRANRAALYMADLAQQLLTEHDPHPALFDALHGSLAALAETDAIPLVLLRFAWAALGETGFRPELDRDAETGGELPAQGTLGFSARAGGAVADTGGPDRWRVRRETIDLIRRVAAGGPGEGADAKGFDRANQLLAAYVREVLGREPAAMRWAFPDLRKR
jgi:DNA repair protein RecO (recombination protein O)